MWDYLGGEGILQNYAPNVHVQVLDPLPASHADPGPRQKWWNH